MPSSSVSPELVTSRSQRMKVEEQWREPACLRGPQPWAQRRLLQRGSMLLPSQVYNTGAHRHGSNSALRTLSSIFTFPLEALSDLLQSSSASDLPRPPPCTRRAGSRAVSAEFCR